jgi:hypothetical protein
MILRAVFIADKVFGGKFIQKGNKNEYQINIDSSRLDNSLVTLLSDKSKVKLPRGIDIANFKLQPTELIFKKQNQNYDYSELEDMQEVSSFGFKPELKFNQENKASFEYQDLGENKADHQEQGEDNSEANIRNDPLSDEEAFKQKVIIEEHSMIRDHVEHQKRNLESVSVYHNNIECASSKSVTLNKINVETQGLIIESDPENKNRTRTNSLFHNSANSHNNKLIPLGLKGNKSLRVKSSKSMKEIDIGNEELGFQQEEKDEHGRVYPRNNQGGTVFNTYNELAQEFFSCVSLCHELLVEEDNGNEEEEEIKLKQSLKRKATD